MRLLRRLKGSLSLRLPSKVNLAACRDSLAHSTKGTPSQRRWLLRLLGGARFQALFHSPLGVLFTFPSRYWFAIGRGRVFSLGGWSPLLRAGFHVSGATPGASPGVPPLRVQGSHLLRPAFPGRSAAEGLCHPAGGARPSPGTPVNPGTAAPERSFARSGLGVARFRSPLLARSLLISLPPGT